MGKVHLLPEQLINQIAAGEVVERPASVVKELCENALDAGATSIRVELASGGLRRILVSDNGCGMSREDALACLERHATSKLADAEGLRKILTLGFRGEAVPAIASVSRFTLTTREASSDVATRLVLDGGKLERQEEIGAPAGTSVLVEDLFFNTPARRKFMKRAETESGHASETVIRLALARPEVGFALVNGERQTFSAAPCPKDPRERIAAALGNEVFKHLVALDHTIGSIRTRGYVASPDFTLGTARGIYTFVNGRFVKDRTLTAAIQRAFADMTMPGRQPAAVLFLEIPPEEIDVNVHPQKLEIRFADSRAAFEAIFGSIQRALKSSPWLKPRASSLKTQEVGAGHGTVPGMNTSVPGMNTSVPGMNTSVPGMGYLPPISEASATYSRLASPIPSPLRLPFNRARHANELERQIEAGVTPLSVEPTNPPASSSSSDSAFRQSPQPSDSSPSPAQGYFSSLRVIGQFARTYIVCEGPGPQLVVIDQHAAHERIKFHQLREAFRARKTIRQAFLFPASIELPLAEARILASHLDEIAKLGFEAEPFGGTSFALKAAPAPLIGCDYRKLLTDLAGELMEVEKGRAFDQAMDEVLARMACHAAVRAHQALSPQEARALLDALDTIDFSTRCPHGRPIASRMDLADLEKQVARR